MNLHSGMQQEPAHPTIDRAEIERRLPHDGAMCLIDRVHSWSTDSIVCHAAAPDHGHPLAAPLRDSFEAPVATARELHAVATIEYAAQAVALHASLMDDETSPRPGMLAKLNEVNLSSRPVHGAITVEAWLVTRSDAGCLYAFEVRDTRGACSSGRLMIAFTS